MASQAHRPFPQPVKTGMKSGATGKPMSTPKFSECSDTKCHRRRRTPVPATGDPSDNPEDSTQPHRRNQSTEAHQDPPGGPKSTPPRHRQRQQAEGTTAAEQGCPPLPSVAERSRCQLLPGTTKLRRRCPTESKNWTSIACHQRRCRHQRRRSHRRS